MILGIYSDLHSNFPALTAMQVAAGHVDRWIALGDSVGLYPQVNEVLDWQRENNALYILGDHESALINGCDLHGSFTGTESIRKQAKIISPKNLDALAGLENVCAIESNGLKICATHFLNHEAQNINHKYLVELRSLEKEYANYDFVFFGHTHLPAVFYGRNTIYINPGSAGFPIDVERRCSMVVLDTQSRCFKFIRFNYDSDKLIKSIQTCGYNEKLITYIQNGHRWI
ncbi:metallophosphoesterase family protein [Polynucleobacter paneuropaeus]|nr:metallophosphoesterase family protein [Polynucleobacter paneuropaeus]